MFEYEQLLIGPRGVLLQGKWESTEATVSSEASTIPPSWSQVLKDLIRDFGLEGFNPVIRNIAAMIRNGTFADVREVKLKLKYDGRVSFQGPVAPYVSKLTTE